MGKLVDHLRISERMDAMSDALARKLGGFFRTNEAVETLLKSLCENITAFQPGDVIVGQDEPYGSVYLIENGWVVRAKIMPDGGRQIVNTCIPGDFAALNAALFARSEFELRCKTAVTAFRVEPAALREALRDQPELASALMWVNAHEESMLAERIVSLGRRSARARAAHVLCEFVARLEIIDQISFPELAIPISQEDFSDILGISLVHTNKVLRALDRDGVIAFRMGMLMIHDRKALERIAGFDDGYLHFTRRDDLR